MKRIFAVVFVLIVLAAFTPLGCFADNVYDDLGGELFYHSGNLGPGVYRILQGEYPLDIGYEVIQLTGQVIFDLNGMTYQTLDYNDSYTIKCAENSDCSLEIKDGLGGGKFLMDGHIEVDHLTISGGEVRANNKSLSIKAHNITIDGGKVTADSITTPNENGDTINISGGTVTGRKQIGCDNNNGNCKINININGGAVVKDTKLISGGTIEIAGNAELTTEIGGILANGSVTIDGGKVSAAESGINAVNGGSITILDGNVINSGIISNGNINIEGGTVTATNYGSTLNSLYAQGDITISGGTVTATATGYQEALAIQALGSVIINGGKVTATGGSSGHGINAEGSITISGGTVEMASGGEYGIYAGSGGITIKGDNTQVTAKATGPSDKAGIYSSGGIDIQGGMVNATGGISGIQANGDTTISGGTVTATGVLYGIRANGSITIKDGGTVKEAYGGEYGIRADGDITIESGGTVTEAYGGYYGISARDITIKDGGTVTEAYGEAYGIHADKSITIKDGGTVAKASGVYSGIHADKSITISGGTVNATGTDRPGIHAGTITIESGSTVTAAGGDRAIDGTVKNAVPGTGWTNKEGTEGKALIELPSDPDTGQSLDSYKKVLFPAPSAVVTFKVENGAWDDGNTGDKTETLYCAQGEDLKLAQNQIPAVGSNPKSGFMTGSWDTEPTAGMVITENTTFTYTYAEKTTAVVDPSPADPGLTYTGQEQALVTAGTASGGTMQYALGEESSAPETGWSSSIPTGTGAGTYFVWYKVAGDQSHSDSPAGGPVKVVIAQKPVTVTAENKSKKPGEPDPELTAVVNGLIGNDTVTYTLSREEGDEPGTYAVTAAGEASQGNYSVSFVNGTFTISEKELRTFTIRYDANGGTGTMAEQTVTEGAAAALTANSFTREHHTFTGWNTKADGSGTAYADQASVTLSADLELFAQWKEADKIIDTDQPALTEVPKELQKKYTSVSALQNALIFELKVNGEPARIEQTVFVDVVLKVSFDGGNHWEIATPDNFPAGGMEVRLDYPEGTGKDTHQFSVSHMFTVGEKAGQMEYPKVTAKDDGLYVWLTGLSPVAIAWREIGTPEETMKVPVEIDSVLQNSGSRGLPNEIREMEVTLTVTLKDGDTEVRTTEPLKLKLTKDAVPPMLDAEFEKVLEGLAPGKQPVTVSVSPKTVFGRDKIYSSEGPVEGPVKWKYELSAKGELNVKDGKIIVRVYLFWDNGSRPEEVRVVALPEDEIGAYKLRPDGTKEYLLFQTYDICMAWLGSDELCRGPERCYHK